MKNHKNLFINKKSSLANKRGYTLLELLVAMSMFTIVLVVVLGLFSMAIKSQRRVIAQQNVQENARFLLEFMAKEIRMSTITSTNSIDGPSPSLALTRSDSDSVTYSISGGKIFRNDSPVSSEQVIVNGYFYIKGRDPNPLINDYLQPQVTIALEVEGVGVKIEEKTKINIQTTLSQRNLDLW